MDSGQLAERPWALASFVFEIWQAGFSTTWIVGTMEAWDKKWTKIGLGWHTTAEMHVHTADTRRGTRVDGGVSQQNLTAKRGAAAGNIVSLSSQITLFKPLNHVTYLRITVHIHVRSSCKNLTFPNYEFGKGHFAFYPIKLSVSRIAEKKYSSSDIPKFHMGNPYKLGQTPLNQPKISKVKHWFGGF